MDIKKRGCIFVGQIKIETMKKTFTKQYLLDNRGCYEVEDVEDIKCINNKVITLKQLFRDLPIKDFSWFLVRKCDLTLSEKRLFVLHCAEQVLPIYEDRYPNDSRVRDCIDATKKYLNNELTLDELRVFRSAANAAADAASAASAANAANAADAAADASSAAYAYAVYAAAYAAKSANKEESFRESILNYITKL